MRGYFRNQPRVAWGGARYHQEIVLAPVCMILSHTLGFPWLHLAWLRCAWFHSFLSFLPSFLPFAWLWLGSASLGSAWLRSALLDSAYSASFGLVWFRSASLGFPWLGFVVLLLFYRTPICSPHVAMSSRRVGGGHTQFSQWQSLHQLLECRGPIIQVD